MHWIAVLIAFIYSLGAGLLGGKPGDESYRLTN